MTKEKVRDLILWITVFAGPVFWLFSFQAKFSFNTWTCASQTKLPLFLFALIAFVLTAGAGLLAWRQWRALDKQSPPERGDLLARSRFMAVGAIAFSVGFCLVILAQTIPDMIIGPCQ
jgi:4-hydroxybenzoate polyprenyltransferase